MADLTQDDMQVFSDRVAEICEDMELEPDQMLDAIGITFIGAALSFGKTDYQVEVAGVASAMVETIFEPGTEAE
tara:strand:- start:8559 stop:8780 length:222 start_codon:yes stop_codon:yes gene_type:complete